MEKLTIETVIGRQVIDSRGNPTVEADVILSDGTVGSGIHPAVPRRDNSRPWNCATVTNPATAARASTKPWKM